MVTGRLLTTICSNWTVIWYGLPSDAGVTATTCPRIFDSRLILPSARQRNVLPQLGGYRFAGFALVGIESVVEHGRQQSARGNLLAPQA